MRKEQRKQRRKKRQRKQSTETTEASQGQTETMETQENHSNKLRDEEEDRVRRNSFPDIEEEESLAPGLQIPMSLDISYVDFLAETRKAGDLTCISEEGIADMELPDHLLEELEILENITSCNRVENYLMLSEYEQNLSKESHEQDSGDFTRQESD